MNLVHIEDIGYPEAFDLIEEEGKVTQKSFVAFLKYKSPYGLDLNLDCVSHITRGTYPTGFARYEKNPLYRGFWNFSTNWLESEKSAFIFKKTGEIQIICIHMNFNAKFYIDGSEIPSWIKDNMLK